MSEEYIKSIFKISKDTGRRGNFYHLLVKDSDKYDEAFSKFKIEKTNKKVEKSIYGNSKKAKSDFSFLLVKQNYDDEIPNVVVFNEQDYQCNFEYSMKQKLMIIENEDNFGNIIDSFNNESIDLNEYNFILGFGNYISDRNFTRFLNEYSEIQCFFDIDLGGLKTFSSLDSRLETEIEFYYSEKMSNYLRKYGTTIKEKDYIETSKYRNNEKLKLVVADILNHKKFAEQEVFQH